MILRLLALLLALLPAWSATLPITTTEVVSSGLANPVGVTYRPGDNAHVFVIEQHTGNVRRVTLATGAVATTPFLTETGITTGGEQGLLGLAFHPNYATNGYVYINCTKSGGGAAGRTVIVRYTANTPYASATTVDAASRVEVLEFNQPYSNHNGGWIGFGADGHLYIASGDGGSGGDPQAYGQNLGSKLGKILRINVATQPYTIPSGNMTGTGVDPTIFAYGLRNPWQCSIDRANGNLWIGDVGQGTREEVSYGPAGVSGRNYGWKRFEGTYLHSDTPLSGPGAHVRPVHEYGRSLGQAIVGGYVYRGAAIPALQGTYLYADYSSQRFWAFTASTAVANTSTADPVSAPGIQEVTSLLDPNNRIGNPSAFGEDASGELYICDRSNGRLHKIVSSITATRVVFTTQPSTVNVGAAITPAVRVAVQDDAGNTVTSATNAITVALASNPGGATLGGTLTVNAVNGVATFSNLTLNAAGTSYTLAASAGGLTGGTSNPFNVLAQVATPVVTPNGGTFSGPVQVQLTSATASATIRYTTNGTAPNAGSPVYTAPFTVSATTTVRAYATRSGFADSNATSATITIAGATPYGIGVRPPATAYLGMPTSGSGSIPAQLSGTGAFSDVAAFTPASALIPYQVNAPFWSDGAYKRRWVSLPNDGAPFGTGETATFAATGEWSFPAGTVFVKHFDLALDERTPNVRRRLETRLLVRAAAGGVYGVTYRWNAGQTNADLVTSAQEEDLTITTATGGTRVQRWYYPSPADCLQCHTTNAGHVLGVNTRQLNGNMDYPASGVNDHQLRAWAQAGLFGNPPAENTLAGLAALSPLEATSTSLEQRARSYLDSNCANCHRPGGAPATFDARYDTPFASQGLVNGNVNNTLGITGAKVVVPRDTARSILYQRIHTTGPNKMPALGRNEIDQAGATLIATWIGAMDDSGNSSGGGGSSPPASNDEDSKCGLGAVSALAMMLMMLLGLRRWRG
jgi:uncharacterized repeat protein (TIGR03806 family)